MVPRFRFSPWPLQRFRTGVLWETDTLPSSPASLDAFRTTASRGPSVWRPPLRRKYCIEDFTLVMLVWSKPQVITQPSITSTNCLRKANVSLQCHYWFFRPSGPEATEGRPVFLAHTITWTTLIKCLPFSESSWVMPPHSTVCATLKLILQPSTE